MRIYVCVSFGIRLFTDLQVFHSEIRNLFSSYPNFYLPTSFSLVMPPSMTRLLIRESIHMGGLSTEIVDRLWKDSKCRSSSSHTTIWIWYPAPVSFPDIVCPYFPDRRVHRFRRTILTNWNDHNQTNDENSHSSNWHAHENVLKLISWFVRSFLQTVLIVIGVHCAKIHGLVQYTYWFRWLYFPRCFQTDHRKWPF